MLEYSLTLEWYFKTSLIWAVVVHLGASCKSLDWIEPRAPQPWSVLMAWNGLGENQCITGVLGKQNGPWGPE